MKQLGTYLADTLTEDGQISKEQQAIYAYLFDYLIEALLSDIVVLIIGLLVHRLDLTLCYLLVTFLSATSQVDFMQIPDLAVPYYPMGFIL